MMTVVIESDYVMHLSALNMRSDWFFLVGLLMAYQMAYHFLTDRHNSLQSADKDQQESRAVAGKPHDAVKFDTNRNLGLQRHCAVLPAIARLSCSFRPKNV